MMDIAVFRASFPEFGDEVKFTDPMIEFWSSFGESLLNEERWGDLLIKGVFLFTAHHITLAYNDFIMSEKGRTPGQSTSLIASKSVGDVSVSFDTSSINLESAGNYNLTRYGREFWQLAMLIGMGGKQV